MKHQPLSNRPSGIAGLGLFADETIPSGTLVMSMPYEGQVIIDDIECFQKMQAGEATTHRAIPVGSRRWIWVPEEVAACDFERLNHSFEPNLLYWEGSFYALRDISRGEELTTDYTDLMVMGDSDVVTDAVTSKTVDGRAFHPNTEEKTVALLNRLTARK